MTHNEWRLLDINYDSVYRNLALEEALIASQQPAETPKIRIWFNPPAIVTGRFQDVHLEADTTLCTRKSITIARRFTGGGTVYHDHGNLNVTMVTWEPIIDLQTIQHRNIAIIKETLLRMGVESAITNSNSISVEGKKISGASLAVKRNLVLWHASLLVSTDLLTVTQILSPSRKQFTTNRVRSRWQPVTNLQTALSRPVETAEVKEQILNTVQDMFDARLRISQLSPSEENMTTRLHDSKYSTAEWNNEGIVK
ncbi:MAG: biotin/lipoate A/B protein ligase family protein [Candidatus Bathyarchaeia archaeon]|jgi:lipoate-protein ligase A